MSAAHTPEVGTTSAPLGIAIHAENIPKGSKKIWKLLNQAYGATAIFTWGDTSVTFFRSIDEGLSFSYMVDDSMLIPEITERAYQTYVGFTDKIEFLSYGKKRDKETRERP